MEKFNVETYRNEHENNSEWNHRRKFLLANFTNPGLSENRLVSLSLCFINSECYGCRYSQQVMNMLKELTSNIKEIDLKSFRNKVRTKTQIQFVKASDGVGSGLSEANAHTSGVVSASRTHPGLMAFVKADEAYKSTDGSIRSLTETSSYQMDPAIIVDKLHKEKEEATQDTSLMQGFATALKCKDVPGFAELHSHDSESDDEDDLMDDQVNLLGAGQDKLAEKIALLKEANPNENPVQLLQIAVAKCQMGILCRMNSHPADPNIYICECHINHILFATGKAKNTKAAKRAAYEAAIEKLINPNNPVITDPVELLSKKRRKKRGKKAMGMVTSSKLAKSEVKMPSMAPMNPVTFSPLISNSNIINPQIKYMREPLLKQSNLQALLQMKGRKRNFATASHDLSSFLIMQPMGDSQEINIIMNSANFSGMLLEFTFHNVNSGVRCVLEIEGFTVSDCMGSSKQEAKLAACTDALKKLRKLCWTVKMTQAVDSDQAQLTKEEIMGDVAKASEKIPESNIGNKMMKMMGWTGGGIGAEGNKGIEDPVTLTQVIDRQGLGLQAVKGIDRSFVPRIRKMLQHYGTSNDQGDLAFDTSFMKEERALIHNECRKLGLKSGSRGSGDNRYLTVSRRRNADQLFDHLWRSGGSTSKYQLLEPGSLSSEQTESTSEQMF